RTTDGKVGLVDEYCAHRRVSLWFGRNEDNGLRCPYHGWKYDVNGHCVEIPSEGGDARSLGIQLKSYPCIELGGVIWTYMGPPEGLRCTAPAGTEASASPGRRDCLRPCVEPARRRTERRPAAPDLPGRARPPRRQGRVPSRNCRRRPVERRQTQGGRRRRVL